MGANRQQKSHQRYRCRACNDDENERKKASTTASKSSGNFFTTGWIQLLTSNCAFVVFRKAVVDVALYKRRLTNSRVTNDQNFEDALGHCAFEGIYSDSRLHFDDTLLEGHFSSNELAEERGTEQIYGLFCGANTLRRKFCINPKCSRKANIRQERKRLLPSLDYKSFTFTPWSGKVEDREDAAVSKIALLTFPADLSASCISCCLPHAHMHVQAEFGLGRLRVGVSDQIRKNLKWRLSHMIMWQKTGESRDHNDVTIATNQSYETDQWAIEAGFEVWIRIFFIQPWHIGWRPPCFSEWRSDLD